MSGELMAPWPVRPRLDPKPWGGRRLAEFGLALPPEGGIGEALITASDAVVAAGPCAGRTLEELAAANPAGVCGTRGLTATAGRPVFPLLIKLIDAAENLSIQVHPDDAAAGAGGSGLLGKTEAWFVLAAEPGATIYAGLAPGRTIEAFVADIRAMQGGTAAHLRHLPAKAGDSLLLPAGTVHALGAGIMVYEVQQPSDITYRLDDWGRVDDAGRPRQLHVAEGLAAVNPLLVPDPIVPVDLHAVAGRRQLLAACRYFALERLALPGGAIVELSADDTPQVVTCLSGMAEVTASGETAALPAGGTVVLPAGVAIVEVRATAPAVLLRAWVPDLVGDVIHPARRAGAADAAIAALGGPSSDLPAALAVSARGRRGCARCSC